MQFKQATNQGQVLTRSLLVVLFCWLAVEGCKKTDAGTATGDATATSKNGADPSRDLDLQLMADNFVSPITLVEPPDGSHRLFVVDQVGKIWIIDANGQKLAQPFLEF